MKLKISKETETDVIQYGICLEDTASSLTQGAGGNYQEGVMTKKWITRK